MSELKILEDTVIKPNPNFDRLLKVLRRHGRPDRIPFYELFGNHGGSHRGEIPGSRFDGKVLL